MANFLKISCIIGKKLYLFEVDIALKFREIKKIDQEGSGEGGKIYSIFKMGRSKISVIRGNLLITLSKKKLLFRPPRHFVRKFV